jgi:photosystem II CP47 chlorophyll apoprotein
MAANSALKIRLPWFRVHILVLNDPGRLISVHVMHTALVAGWSALMLLYELVYLDATDPVYNPIWRQGCYLIPFSSRLGVVRSLYDWSLGIELRDNPYWTYETVGCAHILLSGFAILAAFWHWAYWDLDVFLGGSSRTLVLDLNRIYGIHLGLAAILSFGFGLAHLSGLFGPGMWTADAFGLVGSVRFVKPVYSVIALGPFSYGVIVSNHIIAGFFGIWVAFFHVSSRPGPLLYKLLAMGNLEAVLSTSIAALFWTAFLTEALMWYASVSTSLELFGPSRYHWDNAYFSLDIERRVKSVDSVYLDKAWEEVPEKLVLYDYIGCNPSKGGLFRSGPSVKADGVVQNFLGHPSFELGTLSLAVRRMPAFFEGFPVILMDEGGTLRADIPFRRGGSLYSIEQTGVSLYFVGGILNKTEFATPSVVKSYARKACYGQIFTFDKRGLPVDGVFRTSARGWYSFSHTTLAALFFFGHLWHGGRALFRDLCLGVNIESLDRIDGYGRNEKLGDGAGRDETLVRAYPLNIRSPRLGAA